jgi:hypothetical protein
MARAHGFTKVDAQKGVEMFRGPNGANIEIKFPGNIRKPHSLTLNPEGSWGSRARVQVASGTPQIPRYYVDPFWGGIGKYRSSVAHIPLESTISEAFNLGMGAGVAGAGRRSPCPCD